MFKYPLTNPWHSRTFMDVINIYLVMVSKKRFADMANQEMIFLKTVRDTDPTNPHREKVVRLYDDFKLRGVNGDHCVMVFETLGPNLDKWLLKVNKYVDYKQNNLA